MFPGNSDSLNWGVGCVLPNGPVYWTMETAHENPHDCKGVCSSGPFTFKPGDRQDIDIAFAWARDYESSDPKASLVKLRNVADKINKAFAENKLPDGTPIYGLNEKKVNNELEFRIYPNPVKNLITVELQSNQPEEGLINIFSFQGELILESFMNGQKKVNIDVSNLSSGIYFIQCLSKGSIGTKKFILMR